MRKLIKSSIKYNGPRFNVEQRVYESEFGNEYIRDCVHTQDASVILPITENNEIIFIKQYREIAEEVSLELPAGIIDEGESPEHAAQRECEEETGFKPNSIEFLASYYPSCGYTDEMIYIYIAKDFELTKQNLDETEEILSIEKIPLEKALEMALNNEFRHASINVALFKYYYKYLRGGENG